MTKDDPKIEKDCLSRLRNSGSDGIVIVATGCNSHILKSIPASGVQIVQPVRLQKLDLSNVISDYETAVSMP